MPASCLAWRDGRNGKWQGARRPFHPDSPRAKATVKVLGRTGRSAGAARGAGSRKSLLSHAGNRGAAGAHTARNRCDLQRQGYRRGRRLNASRRFLRRRRSAVRRKESRAPACANGESSPETDSSLPEDRPIYGGTPWLRAWCPSAISASSVTAAPIRRCRSPRLRLPQSCHRGHESSAEKSEARPSLVRRRRVPFAAAGRLFGAARRQEDNQIVHFAARQHSPEGWHSVTASQNLSPDLARRSTQSHGAQVGCALTSDAGNAVTTFAALRVKVERSALLRRLIRSPKDRGQKAGACQNRRTGPDNPWKHRPHAKLILSEYSSQVVARPFTEARIPTGSEYRRWVKGQRGIAW